MVWTSGSIALLLGETSLAVTGSTKKIQRERDVPTLGLQWGARVDKIEEDEALICLGERREKKVGTRLGLSCCSTLNSCCEMGKEKKEGKETMLRNRAAWTSRRGCIRGGRKREKSTVTNDRNYRR